MPSADKGRLLFQHIAKKGFGKWIFVPTWISFFFPNFYKQNKWYRFLYNLTFYIRLLKHYIKNDNTILDLSDIEQNSDENFFEYPYLDDRFKTSNKFEFINERPYMDIQKEIEMGHNYNNKFITDIDITKRLKISEEQSSDILNKSLLHFKNLTIKQALDNIEWNYFQKIMGVQTSLNLDIDRRLYLQRLPSKRNRARNRKKHRGKIKR